MTSYCEYVRNNPQDVLNCKYHDLEYGFPINDDARLFERLVLEINQAGLSWLTILKKKANFQHAYDCFDIDSVAGYGQLEQSRLMDDAGIIRNRLKINAAIENAKKIQVLRQEFGSFKNWLDTHQEYSLEDWVSLFKQNFLFTGREIVSEFLMSTGYLPGAHDRDCPVFQRIAAAHPYWMRKERINKSHSDC
jgi:DNA-3-methyladenine glycosylase I